MIFEKKALMERAWLKLTMMVKALTTRNKMMARFSLEEGGGLFVAGRGPKSFFSIHRPIATQAEISTPALANGRKKIRQYIENRIILSRLLEIFLLMWGF